MIYRLANLVKLISCKDDNMPQLINRFLIIEVTEKFSIYFRQFFARVVLSFLFFLMSRLSLKLHVMGEPTESHVTIPHAMHLIL